MESGGIVISFGWDSTIIYFDGVIDAIVSTWVLAPIITYIVVKRLAAKVTSRKKDQETLLGVVTPRESGKRTLDL